MKKEKEMSASFVVDPQIAKVMAKMGDQCLVKRKKNIKFEREREFLLWLSGSKNNQYP